MRGINLHKMHEQTEQLQVALEDTGRFCGEFELTGRQAQLLEQIQDNLDSAMRAMNELELCKRATRKDAATWDALGMQGARIS